MAVALKKLIEKIAHLDVVPVAGESGMDRPVTWIQMVESIEVSTFLEDDEIAIVTGISMKSSDELLPLVRVLDEKNASGIILNTGPYIDKVPQEVLDYCNDADLPFFTVPWRIRISEIMRILCYEITKEDQKNFQQSSAFKNAIFFPSQTELYMVPLSEYGYQTENPFTVAVVQIRKDREEKSDTIYERLDNLCFRLTFTLAHTFRKFSIFPYNEEIIAVMADYSAEQITKFIAALSHHIGDVLHEKQNEKYTIGVGKTTQSARCIYKSYRQAVTVCRLQYGGITKKGSVYYAEMGLYKLLMNIEDREVLEDYYAHTIKPLADYDSDHQTNLVAVLASYLFHNCSVQEAAEELFIHRNTVNYRLNKISELTHMDLSSQKSRLELQAGLMVKNIL